MPGAAGHVRIWIRRLSHLRASNADREQVIGTLKAAFVQGRLTKDELDTRVGQTFAARTYAELAALTAGLPARMATAQPLRRPSRARARRPMDKTVIWGACGIITPAMLMLGVAAAHFNADDSTVSSFVTGAFGYLLVWLILGMTMIDSWHQERSSGRLPPQPAPARPGLPSGEAHHVTP